MVTLAGHILGAVGLRMLDREEGGGGSREPPWDSGGGSSLERWQGIDAVISEGKQVEGLEGGICLFGGRCYLRLARAVPHGWGGCISAGHLNVSIWRDLLGEICSELALLFIVCFVMMDCPATLVLSYSHVLNLNETDRAHKSGSRTPLFRWKSPLIQMHLNIRITHIS
ncbi:hypothetical protein BJX70DRAFT_152316 [Aspergillus crustosus]